jgi:hypothetical protein
MISQFVSTLETRATQHNTTTPDRDLALPGITTWIKINNNNNNNNNASDNNNDNNKPQH